MKISVIGGGCIGSYSAYLLSKNFDVSLFEEHKIIGEPVQCTGIVTKKINDVIKLPKDVVVNKLKYAKVHSPDGNILKIKANDIVIDRAGFDKFLYKKAVDNGVKGNLASKFITYNRSKKSVSVTKKQ